jgi:hypothetical protein
MEIEKTFRDNMGVVPHNRIVSTSQLVLFPASVSQESLHESFVVPANTLAPSIWTLHSLEEGTTYVPVPNSPKLVLDDYSNRNLSYFRYKLEYFVT